MDKLNWRKNLFNKVSLSNSLRSYVLRPHTIRSKTYQDHLWPSSHHVLSESHEDRHYIDHQTEAELDFQKWQLQDGREVFQRGVGPQDASEHRNLMAFQEDQGIEETIPQHDTHRSDEMFIPQGEPKFYENSVETTDEIPFSDPPEPEVIEPLFDIELVGSTSIHEFTAIDPNPMEDHMDDPMEMDPNPMNSAPIHQFTAVNPEPMEPSINDQCNPMNPMEMDPFDPMNPMGMGGLFGP